MVLNKLKTMNKHCGVNMKNIHKALILSSAIMAGNSHAEITFNGFASIVGGVTTSSDETLYGYDDTINFSPGSLVALQASSDLGEGLSVTAQILARGEDDWDPDFEWAYIAYDASDNLRILAGRQRVPFYMYSDFLDVSYAYPWIEPPAGVYSLGFSTFDGIGAMYNSSIGSFDSSIHIIYGGNTSDLFIQGEPQTSRLRDLVGAAWTLNRDWLTLRVAYFQADTSIDVPDVTPLVDGWSQAGFPEVGEGLKIEGDLGAFTEVGFQIDYENILIIGEYTLLTLDNTLLADDANSYFLMGGYRFDNVLVHVTYGWDDSIKDRITNDVPVIPQLLPLIIPTNGITDGQAEESNYITLGLRWDFHDSAALKFEYTSYSDDLNSNNDAGLFRTALVTVF